MSILRFLIVLAVALFAGELFARFYLGLGDPPLFVTHRAIEYMYKPNQDVYRFGNHFIVNQYAMRSDPFTLSKEDHEFRVMVFGDSILNGGNLTDQDDLATSILKNKLAKAGYENIVVGNISAGSWGPGNWLAYAREYGFFDADIVALIVSSHDYDDNPTFRPLNQNTHPTYKPLTALSEGITRYLPRYLPELNSAKVEADHSKKTSQIAIVRALEDLGQFLRLAKQHSTVLVLQHPDAEELEQHSLLPGYARIKTVCEQEGVSVVSLAPYYRRSINSGNEPYRDHIHLSDIGQRLLAKAIISNVPN